MTGTCSTLNYVEYVTRDGVRGAERADKAWFPEGAGPIPRAIEAAAKRICHDCPIRVECLALAVANDEQHGIWGGISFARPRNSRGVDEATRLGIRRRRPAPTHWRPIQWTGGAA